MKKEMRSEVAINPGSKASSAENEMHTWHRQSPAAHVLFSDKVILGAQVLSGGGGGGFPPSVVARLASSDVLPFTP